MFVCLLIGHIVSSENQQHRSRTSHVSSEYLHNIHEVEHTSRINSCLDLGITPNIVKKSVEKLELLFHIKQHPGPNYNLVKSSSMSALDYPITFDDTFDVKKDKSCIRRASTVANIPKTISYYEGLNTLGGIEPQIYRKRFGKNKSLSLGNINEGHTLDLPIESTIIYSDVEETDEDLFDLRKLSDYEVKEESCSDLSRKKGKQKMISNSCQSLVLQSSSSSESNYRKKRLQVKKTKGKNKKEQIDSFVNTSEIASSSSFMNIDKPKFLIGDVSLRESYFNSSESSDINFLLHFTELSKTNLDDNVETASNMEIAILPGEASSVPEQESDEAKTSSHFSDNMFFYYIPDYHVFSVTDEKLLKYKRRFGIACKLFEFDKKLLTSFTALVYAYKHYVDKFIQKKEHNVKKNLVSLFHSKYNKIRSILTNLGSLKDIDAIFEKVHQEKNKIYLNGKIVKLLKECSKEKDNQNIAFCTCIENVKYDINLLELAFYTIAQYCYQQL